MYVEDADGPVKASGVEVFAAKVEKRNVVAHRRLYIGDKCQYVRDGNLRRVMIVDAAIFEAASSFDHPEVLPQVIHANIELLRPEIEEVLKAIDTTIRVAIMPAINQAERLCTPVPVTTRMHNRVHRLLHLI